MRISGWGLPLRNGCLTAAGVGVWCFGNQESLLSGATPDPSEPARDADAASRLQLTQALQRAKYAIAWERSWPHFARLLTVAGLFLAVSWAGLWLALPFVARAIGLGLFVFLALGAVFPLLRFRWPSREAALNRLDRGTGIRHRPATALTDTLATQDPVALALWQAQRERTLASIRRIRAGLPSPRLPFHDPWALRALVAVMMVAAYVAAGDERMLRVAAAFDWNGVLSPANIRVDAWVTPPVYTGKPPIILSAANKEAATPAAGPLPATAPRMSARPPVSRNGNSAPSPIAPRPSRLRKTRNVRPAARCRCPTRSRMIMASPKRRRALRSVRVRRRKLRSRKVRPSRGRCSTRRNFRWCFRMRGPAMASDRQSRISAR